MPGSLRLYVCPLYVSSLPKVTRATLVVGRRGHYNTSLYSFFYSAYEENYTIVVIWIIGRMLYTTIHDPWDLVYHNLRSSDALDRNHES